MNIAEQPHDKSLIPPAESAGGINADPSKSMQYRLSLSQPLALQQMELTQNHLDTPLEGFIKSELDATSTVHVVQAPEQREDARLHAIRKARTKHHPDTYVRPRDYRPGRKREAHTAGTTPQATRASRERTVLEEAAHMHRDLLGLTPTPPNRRLMVADIETVQEPSADSGLYPYNTDMSLEWLNVLTTDPTYNQFPDSDRHIPESSGTELSVVDGSVPEVSNAFEADVLSEHDVEDQQPTPPRFPEIWNAPGMPSYGTLRGVTRHNLVRLRDEDLAPDQGSQPDDAQLNNAAPKNQFLLSSVGVVYRTSTPRASIPAPNTADSVLAGAYATHLKRVAHLHAADRNGEAHQPSRLTETVSRFATWLRPASMTLDKVVQEVTGAGRYRRRNEEYMYEVTLRDLVEAMKGAGESVHDIEIFRRQQVTQLEEEILEERIRLLKQTPVTRPARLAARVAEHSRAADKVGVALMLGTIAVSMVVGGIAGATGGDADFARTAAETAVGGAVGFVSGLLLGRAASRQEHMRLLTPNGEKDARDAIQDQATRLGNLQISQKVGVTDSIEVASRRQRREHLRFELAAGMLGGAAVGSGILLGELATDIWSATHVVQMLQPHAVATAPAAHPTPRPTIQPTPRPHATPTATSTPTHSGGQPVGSGSRRGDEVHHGGGAPNRGDVSTVYSSISPSQVPWEVCKLMNIVDPRHAMDPMQRIANVVVRHANQGYTLQWYGRYQEVFLHGHLLNPEQQEAFNRLVLAS